MMLLMRQFWLSGHFALFMQLQVLSLMMVLAFVIVWDYFHVWQVAIAYLHSISVKYFMELVVRWTMLI